MPGLSPARDRWLGDGLLGMPKQALAFIRRDCRLHSGRHYGVPAYCSRDSQTPGSLRPTPIFMVDTQRNYHGILPSVPHCVPDFLFDSIPTASHRRLDDALDHLLPHGRARHSNHAEKRRAIQPCLEGPQKGVVFMLSLFWWSHTGHHRGNSERVLGVQNVSKDLERSLSP